VNSSSLPTEKPARYSAVAILLHWVLGLAILGAFGVGLLLEEMPLSPFKFQLISWHKWAGICILAGSAFRLLWRVTHRPPALTVQQQSAMVGWQHTVYRLTHVAFYALFFIVPLCGWAYSSAKGYPVVLFGLWPLPDLVGKNPALAELFEEGHAIGAFVLIGLVVVHALAAIKHQAIDRDGLMNRMRP
jgi:cytochrome b561